jgi:hypothetical protein
MDLRVEEWEQSEIYLSGFDILIGDERTRRTFRGVIEGIIGGESLRAAVIARFSPGHSGNEVWREASETDGERGNNAAQ